MSQRVFAFNLMRYKFGCLIAFACIFMLASCSRKEIWLHGYIEGRFTYVSAQFSGVIQQLFVKRGMMVKKGDLLFILEEEPESKQLEEAEGNLAQAQAERIEALSEIERSQLDHQRQRKLLEKNVTEKATFDNARIQLDKAKAKLQNIEANISALQAILANRKWRYTKKTMAAPKTALVYDTYYLSGELVPASRPVLSLLAPEDIRIALYVSESQLGSIQVGQKAEIRCDGCATPLIGKIDFISPKAEFTPPVIYSEKERAKLVYRVDVIPDPNEISRLHPGQPVDVKIILSKISLYMTKNKPVRPEEAR